MKRKRLRDTRIVPPSQGRTCIVLYDKKPPTKQEREQIKQAFDRHEASRRFKRNEIDPYHYGHC